MVVLADVTVNVNTIVVSGSGTIEDPGLSTEEAVEAVGSVSSVDVPIVMGVE